MKILKIQKNRKEQTLELKKSFGSGFGFGFKNPKLIFRFQRLKRNP